MDSAKVVILCSITSWQKNESNTRQLENDDTQFFYQFCQKFIIPKTLEAQIAISNRPDVSPLLPTIYKQILYISKKIVDQ